MNKISITRSLIALSLLGGVLVSCDKDEDKIVVSASPLSTPKASATSVTPNVENLSATALTLSWSKATFSSDLVAPVYEMVVKAKDKEPVVLSIEGSKTTHSFTGKELNELLLDKFKFAVGIPVELSFEIRSYPRKLSTSLAPSGSSLTVSSPVVIVVTPVNAVLESENYYFVGSGLGAEAWNINFIGYPFFKSSPDAKEYTYTGKFDANSQFKVFSENAVGDWGKVLGRAGSKLAPGDNIDDIKVAGYYTVTINPTAGTYSITPSTTSLTEYNSISIIGSAVGGWEPANDILLEKSTFNPHIWTKSGVNISEGELKFRVNQEWSISWGVSSGIFPASAADGGDNIKIPAKNAGTYDVFFNDITKHFLFRKK